MEIWIFAALIWAGNFIYMFLSYTQIELQDIVEWVYTILHREQVREEKEQERKQQERFCLEHCTSSRIQAVQIAFDRIAMAQNQEKGKEVYKKWI